MIDQSKAFILSVNGGSSSLKFSLYNHLSFDLEWAGSITRIGEKDGRLEITDHSNNPLESRASNYKNFEVAVKEVITWLKKNERQYPLFAIGHRLVQGGPEHCKPVTINDKLLTYLEQFIYLAPNHLPDEIKIIRAFQSAYPQTEQIACFDTSFHRNMPSYVQNYPLPSKYKDKGLMKYGFHGISYQSIMHQLADEYSSVTEQKIIIAHLGNGASMAAVKNGLSFDTTMGMSPIGGLVMGTRSGDLDPGVLLYLLNQYKLTSTQIDEMLSKHSGMKAIAGVSDMQELLEMEPNNIKAREALTTFCYSAKKFIGALAAAMGGLDMLVFTGGVGENSAVIRERICKDLNFIGIDIDNKKNLKNETLISKNANRVAVRVIKTNEERMIAHLVGHILNHAVKQ